MFFGLPGDLNGLCKPGWKALVLCEGCGVVKVDHRGWCVSSCLENHQEPSSADSLRLNRAWSQWERRTGPLGWLYRLKDAYFGSPWAPGHYHFYKAMWGDLYYSVKTGTPLYVIDEQLGGYTPFGDII